MSSQSRLLWRCRRGIREMDLLLEKYVRYCYPDLNKAEQERFEAFLEEADLDILSWIMGRADPDNDSYRKFVRQLQQINAANPANGTMTDDV